MTSKLTITRERLSGIARGENCYTHDDVIELALAQLAAMDSEPHTDDELSNLLWYSQEATCHSDPNYFCEFQRLATPGFIASIILELQERRKAAMDSEPVAWMHSNNDIGIPAITVSQKIGHYWMAEFENVQPLYRHAQPAPVVPDELLSMAASAIEDLLEHTDPNTSYYSGLWADVPGKLRAAAMLQAGNSPVIPDGYVMVPKDISPEQLRAFQLKTKIGAYVTANWSNAYDSLRELWNEVIVHYFKNQNDGLKK